MVFFVPCLDKDAYLCSGVIKFAYYGHKPERHEGEVDERIQKSCILRFPRKEYV